MHYMQNGGMSGKDYLKWTNVALTQKMDKRCVDSSAVCPELCRVSNPAKFRIFYDSNWPENSRSYS